MNDESKQAKEFIQEFLNRLTDGYVAAFHISYVGFEDDQRASITGGHEKGEELLALMKIAVEGTEEVLGRTVQ